MLSSGEAVTEFEGAAPEGEGVSHDLLEMLAKTLDRQVLPKVAAALPGAPAMLPIARLCAERLVLGQADAFARALAEANRAGSKPEQICLTLLTDVARELGRLWEQDRCSFVDVTLGICQAQEALFRLAPSFATPSFGHGRSILIGPVPGEQHGFGVSMVAEFFRQGGWVVAAAPLDGAAGWERAVAGTWFDVVGLSLGSADHLAGLRTLIASLRRRSSNPALAVMVGGPLLVHRPELVREVGADATAADAGEALCVAHSLLRLSVNAA
jgi:methanogenic corrinoid protein MtbC1